MKFDIRTIIVPFDFSARCRAAALHAVGLARRYDASMLFVHVIPYSSFEYTAFEGGSYVGQAWPSEADIETRLRSEVAQLEIADDVKERIHIRALKGDPPRKIEEAADSAEAPLIVLPTHGYGPFRRFVLGSVTTKILHDLTCPVFTGAHVPEIPIYGSKPYQRVACAVDLRCASPPR